MIVLKFIGEEMRGQSLLYWKHRPAWKENFIKKLSQIIKSASHKPQQQSPSNMCYFLKVRNRQLMVKSKAYYKILTINLENFNKNFGNILIKNLKPIDLENYQALKKEAGYSDSYIDQVIGAARTMINKAFDNDMIGGDVLRTFKRVRKLLKKNANARDMVITPDQFIKLMNEMPRHSRVILATAFYTGMRRGEILSLTWDKVDYKKRLITLASEDTKDREPRNIPICDELFDILKEIPRSINNNHVFLFRGKPIKDIRTALRRACKKIGLMYGREEKGGFVFHDLRHTFNTYMRKASVAESVIMKITGHATREMFDRYNTVDDEDTRLAFSKFRGLLKSVDQNVDQGCL